MTNPGHTPGPWKCERLIDKNGKPCATLYECHIDLGPCMIWAPIGNAEQEANARLIAASPRMLAALKAFANARFNELDDAHDEALAAIKEAEGTQ
jgi:hypothetical protein